MLCVAYTHRMLHTDSVIVILFYGLSQTVCVFTFTRSINKTYFLCVVEMTTSAAKKMSKATSSNYQWWASSAVKNQLSESQAKKCSLLTFSHMSQNIQGVTEFFGDELWTPGRKKTTRTLNRTLTQSSGHEKLVFWSFTSATTTF